MLDNTCERRAWTTRRKAGWCFSFPTYIVMCTLAVQSGQSVVALSENGSPSRTWKTLGELSALIRYRTDQHFVKKEDMFSYSPALRRVRHQNSMRRNDGFPQMAMTLGDASGRSAWEYTWTVLGTDVLFETVRFPVTRPTVTMNRGLRNEDRFLPSVGRRMGYSDLIAEHIPLSS